MRNFDESLFTYIQHCYSIMLLIVLSVSLTILLDSVWQELKGGGSEARFP